MDRVLKEFYTPNDAELVSNTDSRSIQNAISAAIETGCNIVIIPRYNARSNSYLWSIDETILLPDNITVVLDGCFMELAEGCFCNMFRNSASHKEEGKTLEGEQKNIRLIGRNGAVLDGGVYNGHCEWNTTADVLINNTTVLLTNVDGFTVCDLKIRHQRWWGMTCIFCRNGVLRNIEFEADLASVGPNGERTPVLPKRFEDAFIKNGDGIDLRSGCNNILVENITGITGDDAVALTALKGSLEHKFYVEGKKWEIYAVTVKNVTTYVWSGAQLRLLCADGCKVHDIVADSLMDTTPDPKFGITGVFVGYAMDEYIHEALPVRGDLYNISISNVFTRSRYGVLLGCAVDNMRLTNLFCKPGTYYAISSNNYTRLSNVIIDGVFCAEGSCMDSLFNFGEDTSGSINITNVHCPSTKYVIRNAGKLNINLRDCYVDKISGSLSTNEFNEYLK